MGRSRTHARPHPAIDLDRLRRDLEALGRIGFSEAAGGLHRESFSDADMQARHWFIARLAEAGLDAEMDGAGNVIGRWQTGRGPAILIGSHLDSVPAGGMFDGALGVVAGLECVRTLREHGIAPGCPLEVIATSEEEGRFGGMLGAQALCGQLSRAQIEAARDESGLALTEAMARQGLDPAAALRAARDPGAVKAFVELHVEQGPVLEARGIPVGIVEGISGVFNWTVTLRGRANHAGTTPMDLRRDAFMGLADFAGRIPEIIDRSGTTQSRLTVGRVELEPNFPHTVPGAAEFSLIGRDVDEAVMQALAEACRAALMRAAENHGLVLETREISWLAPKRCHPEVIAAFRAQAERLGIGTLTMPSGAGHDTQLMSEITRAGMIFVPSIGGVSHAPQERTDWADIETGSNLLLHTILALAEA